jgi:adenylate cyclase
MLASEVARAAERRDGSLPGAREVAVGFGDLVGFTRLGEDVPPDELGAVASRLEDLAGEVIAPPVRIVKTIGDAVMYVSDDPVALLAASIDLSVAADSQGEEFPQLRIGTASGQAIQRAGDWFGRPVNLASRVTGIARPGSVVCTEPLKEAAPDDGFSFSFIGARKIKGVPGSTALFRARKRTDGGNGEAGER